MAVDNLFNKAFGGTSDGGLLSLLGMGGGGSDMLGNAAPTWSLRRSLCERLLGF